MNDLLARLSPGAARPAEAVRPTHLQPLLEGIVAAKRNARAVQLSCDASLAALADQGGLEQAISHLVQNAIDASPDDVPVGIRFFESGGDVAIEIVDPGEGMSGDFIATSLFQPFVSTKEQGFGVGAYEARELITGMGGRLEVESAPGRGTCFTIYLPATAAEPERMRA